MKKFILFVYSLICGLFGKKNLPVEKTSQSSQSGNVTTKPCVPVIRQRRRLSQIMESLSLPAVNAEILGKHRVRCRDKEISGDFKILGQIGDNGFARIRSFGQCGATQHMVRLIS